MTLPWLLCGQYSPVTSCAAYMNKRILAEQMQVLSHSSKIYTLLQRITLEITRLEKKKDQNAGTGFLL